VVRKVVGVRMVHRRVKHAGRKGDAGAAVVRMRGRRREIEVPAGHAAVKGEVPATEALAIGDLVGQMVRRDLRVPSGCSIASTKTRTAR
jgi:hypothetical protein